MKNFASGKTVLCALGFCALFGATAARAQNYMIQVDVPFQFVAGERCIPPAITGSRSTPSFTR